MKALMLAATIVVATAFSTFAQPACVRHAEAKGPFSYCPPTGWTAEASRTGNEFKVVFAPAGDGFRANLNFRQAITELGHDEFVAASIRILLEKPVTAGAETSKLVSWTKFSTDTGLTGSRLYFETAFNGTMIHSAQYILDGPGKKAVITGTSLAADKARLDPVFEAAVRSFRFSL